MEDEVLPLGTDIRNKAKQYRPNIQILFTKEKDCEKIGDGESDGCVPGDRNFVAGAQEKFPTSPSKWLSPLQRVAPPMSWTIGGQVCPQVFDKPLVIVNKPGGGGVTGTEGVVRSKPDGYSLFLGYGSGHDLVEPHFKKLPYDTFGDLLPGLPLVDSFRLHDHSV